MDIHEYQAKEILSGYGVPVGVGGLAYSPEQAAYRAQEIGGKSGLLKRKSILAHVVKQVVLKYVKAAKRFLEQLKNYSEKTDYTPNR